MSYNSILQDNNKELEAILAAINSLPDAGGGETGVPESCSVEFNVFSDTAVTTYLGVFWDESDPRFIPGAFENTDTVVKNSLVAIYAPHVYGYDINGDVSLIGENSDYNFFSFWVFGNGYISIG